MKMRKITAFAAAIIALIAAFAIIPSVKTVTYADEVSSATFVYSYESYDNTEIVKKVFGIDDVKKLGEGTYYFAYTKKGDTGDVEKDVSVSGGKTTFLCAPGLYEMSVYSLKEDNRLDVEGYGKKEFKVIEANDVKGSSMKYVSDVKDKIAEYLGSSDAENKDTKTVYGVLNANDKKLGDSFTYPDLTNLIVSDYFDYSALKSNLTLNYCQPGSSSFTSTSSKSFKLNGIGTYSFYITGKDPIGKGTIEVDSEKHERKVVKGVDGWYVKGTEELVCPIISFEFSAIKKPRITLEKPEKCFVGLLYKDVSSIITVEATNESKLYTLYYSETELSASFKAENSDKNWNDDGIDYLKSKATLIADDADEKFSTSTLNFTPQKKGYYYVVCEVADNYGKVAIVTDPITVAGEYKEVSYEREFLKYNWVSVLFFCIAVLCFIGLVLVIFIKPKDKTNAADTDVTPTAKK